MEQLHQAIYAACLACLLLPAARTAIPTGAVNSASAPPPFQKATNSGAQEPSLPPSAGPRCGDSSTQVTLCFPGSAEEAGCEYAVTNGQGTAPAAPCPNELLFDRDCSVLPGLLIVAYGPCNQVSVHGSGRNYAATVLPISVWLDKLGLRAIKEVGGFLVRGYAYQSTPEETEAVDLLPELRKVGDIVPVTLDNAKLSPLTIAGAFVPPFAAVEDLEGGMLIENTPNVNFTGLFGSLRVIKGPIVIVGNPTLTSLAGLEGLAEHDSLGNLEIFSNARLQDISALASVLRCKKDGSSSITPSSAVVGAIEVVLSLNPSVRCLLSTVTEVCLSIMAPEACPSGTLSFDGYRFPNGLAPTPQPAVTLTTLLSLPIDPLLVAAAPGSSVVPTTG